MRTFSLIGLLMALAGGYYVYSRQAESLGSSTQLGAPGTTIDMVGVRTDLMGFANAERQQFALEGRYLTLDALRAKGVALPPATRGPYEYSAEVSDSDFRIVANYAGAAGPDAPRPLSIGPTMQIQ